MKYLPSLLMFTGLLISSCDTVDEPPQRVKRVAKYPAEGQPQQYPPQTQPFNPNGAPQTDQPREETTASAPAPAAATTKPSKGDYPYGIPVPGKAHLVESPFSPGKYVDVEGFPPGTEVKDPYTQKIFLVP
ncbi:MAG: hypothetical protein ABJB69_08225 [Spartobacteria bacterium]